jgi:hypothetical protein
LIDGIEKGIFQLLFKVFHASEAFLLKLEIKRINGNHLLAAENQAAS